MEANRENVAVARKNAQLNDAANLTVVHAAVSDGEGTLTFALRSNGHVAERSGAGTISVPSLTVNRLTALHGPPALVCVDVEGYELHALRGAHATLATHRPDLFIEVHTGCGLEAAGGTVSDLLAAIPAGYDLHVSPKTAGGGGTSRLFRSRTRRCPRAPSWSSRSIGIGTPHSVSKGTTDGRSAALTAGQ